ncbi:MAG: Hsp33 family molecular chaperone HslO, partial [Mesorhizobium sp.]|nr:Hsp33 family molecular chaperone HslO [Mesorhizobium sp.]
MSETGRKLGEFGFAGDDHVVPFEVASLDIRGRTVQMGPLLDEILGRHDYPEPVARLLAEAIVLTALLGTSLKFEGKFILQTRTDGPVDMLVADFSTPDAMRAYARFDAARVDEAVRRG